MATGWPAPTRRPRTTTFAYDADGRRTGNTYSDGTTPRVTESYDAAGRRTGMTDGTGSSSFGSANLGQLTSQTNGAGPTVGCTRDPAGTGTSNWTDNTPSFTGGAPLLGCLLACVESRS